MKSHRQFVRRLRRLAIGLIAIGALVLVSAASALEDPGSSPSASNVAAKVGDTPADFPGTRSALQTPKVGDTPADFPGTDGAPDVLVAPVTLPGHTIVREVNDVLPLILAGVALLIALATAAYTLRGVLVARRNVVRPSH
jgi:hypothetical protein